MANWRCGAGAATPAVVSTRAAWTLASTCGAGGGAGAGVRRVPQAQLRTQAVVAVRVPHRLEHRAQADQCLVPGASCPTEQALT